MVSVNKSKKLTSIKQTNPNTEKEDCQSGDRRGRARPIQFI